MHLPDHVMLVHVFFHEHNGLLSNAFSSCTLFSGKFFFSVLVHE